MHVENFGSENFGMLYATTKMCIPPPAAELEASVSVLVWQLDGVM